MDKYNRFNAGAILFSFMAVGLVCLISYLQDWHADQVSIAYELGRQDNSRLLTIEQIQEHIGAESDGVWGKETTRLYNIALCNQFAVDSFKGRSK